MKLKSILTSTVKLSLWAQPQLPPISKSALSMLAQWATAAGHTNTIKAVKLWSGIRRSHRNDLSSVQGADSERVMTQMALQGADLIFTTSFGYMDPTINVAKKFPNVKFEHATGYKRADNVSTYSARFYEDRAVQEPYRGQND